jgi:hypothetical protein
MEISNHALYRINERVMPASKTKALRLAKEAYKNGYTVEELEGEFKGLAEKMRNKLKDSSERTELRLYKDFIWLWNGRQKVLRTVYPVEGSIVYKKELKLLKKKEEGRENKNEHNGKSARAL